jgi:fimbrial isopeptide formation D2 family protein
VKYMLLIAMMLFVFFVLGMSTAAGQSVSGGGSIPPIVGFTKTVSPTTATAGETVQYAIRFTIPVTAPYTATVVVSDVLDSRLQVVPASQSAHRADGSPIGEFQAITNSNHAVGWSSEITSGDEITITFDITVARGVTAAEVVTNTVLLYAADSEPAALTTTALLLLQPFTTSLPILQRGLDKFPVLTNGNFESGHDAGWIERPGNIIYLYSAISNFAPPGDNAANRYLAWLGGKNNTINELTHEVELPRGYTEAGLRYKYWIESAQPGCSQDTAELKITALGAATPLSYLITLCSAANTQLPGQADGWRDALFDLTGAIPKVAHPVTETTLTITFKTVLNEESVSNLWIDDVVLCSDQAGAVGAERCTIGLEKDE